MSDFLFSTGIENSYPVIALPDGTRHRVDEMEKCGHYRRWRDDFALAKDIGCDALRFGPPYYATHLGPDRYDWQFSDETFAALDELEADADRGPAPLRRPRLGGRLSEPAVAGALRRLRPRVRGAFPEAPLLHPDQRDFHHRALLCRARLVERAAHGRSPVRHRPQASVPGQSARHAKHPAGAARRRLRPERVVRVFPRRGSRASSRSPTSSTRSAFSRSISPTGTRCESGCTSTCSITA